MATASVTSPNPPADPSLPLVLLVDDEPALLRMLVVWLNDPSVRVVTATSGLQALTLLEREGGAAVVVADHYMAGMSGLRLLDAVQNRWPKARRILFTGFADSELVLEARAHKVLTKEMDRELLKRAILREARR